MEITEIRKKQEQLKKDEIRKELAERKKAKEELEKIANLQKEQELLAKKKQDLISKEIEEVKKLENDIYILLGIDLED